MEPTVTSSSTPAATCVVLDRLRGMFRGQPADESVGSMIMAQRALGVVRGGATVLDVREGSEWKSGHEPGPAHVSLGDIDKAPRRLRQGRLLVVTSASGRRSPTAARHLRSLGWDGASLSGGIGACQRAGGEIR